VRWDLVRTRARLLALPAVLATLLTAGCASSGGPVDLAAVSSVSGPQPVGVGGGPTATSSAGPPPNCGDPTASLKPGGLPAPGAMPGGSTMAKIAARGRLIAGVDQNTFPFGYRNPATGELEGFDIDRVRDIAGAIFGDRNRIQFKVITSKDREDVLQKGEVDIVARTYTVNCARLDKVSFSTVYYVSGQRVLVNRGSGVKGIADLGGKKVCATAGSTSLTNIAAQAAHPVPVSVPDWSDCLVMLQQGQVSAVSTDDVILSGLAAQDPNIEVVGTRFTDEPYGVGVPKGQDDMVRFVNGVLDQSRGNGVWKNSYVQWVGNRLGAIPDPPQPKYRD